MKMKAVRIGKMVGFLFDENEQRILEIEEGKTYGIELWPADAEDAS